RLLAQVERIRRLNQELDGFQVLVGTEVDILADGQLDYPDELLAQLDFVVASIHSHMSQDPETLLEWYRKALASPGVDCIGHPTGRLLGRREAMAVPVRSEERRVGKRGGDSR